MALPTKRMLSRRQGRWRSIPAISRWPMIPAWRWMRLNGAPGIYSARYSGEEGDDQKNNEKLLAVLKRRSGGKTNRAFCLCLGACAPNSSGMKEWTVRESCEGRIALTPKGQNGFGYDPLFFYPPYGQNFRRNRSRNQSDSEPSGQSVEEIGARYCQPSSILGQNLDFKARLCRMTWSFDGA